LPKRQSNIGQCPTPQGDPETIDSFAARLDWLRNGVRWVYNEDSERREYITLPAHEADRRLLSEMKRFLVSRGEFFRAPYPYYFDREMNNLMRLDGKDPGPEFMHFLRRLHLFDTQKATKLIASNIRQIGEVSAKRELHRLSFMSPTLSI
jgi:hypothetical protein